MIPVLLTSLDREDAEFVRLALVRAPAVLGDYQQVATALTRETNRGEDLFRTRALTQTLIAELDF